MSNSERPPDDIPEPQRRSGAAAGLIMIALVVVIGAGVLLLWASPWDDDTDQDPALPGFQEEPTIVPNDNGEPVPGVDTGEGGAAEGHEETSPGDRE